jgi:hypothetical protein
MEGHDGHIFEGRGIYIDRCTIELDRRQVGS